MKHFADVEASRVWLCVITGAPSLRTVRNSVCLASIKLVGYVGRGLSLLVEAQGAGSILVERAAFLISARWVQLHVEVWY